MQFFNVLSFLPLSFHPSRFSFLHIHLHSLATHLRVIDRVGGSAFTSTHRQTKATRIGWTIVGTQTQTLLVQKTTLKHGMASKYFTGLHDVGLIRRMLGEDGLLWGNKMLTIKIWSFGEIRRRFSRKCLGMSLSAVKLETWKSTLCLCNTTQVTRTTERLQIIRSGILSWLMQLQTRRLRPNSVPTFSFIRTGLLLLSTAKDCECRKQYCMDQCAWLKTTTILRRKTWEDSFLNATTAKSGQAQP